MDLAALQRALDIVVATGDPEPLSSQLRAEGWRTPLKAASATQDEILARIKVDPETGCWNWTLKLRNGYGKFRGVLAHRLAWEAFIGPVPKGLHLDHVCRNRRCVRPDPKHLEPVTKAENNRRAMAYVQQYPGEQVHNNAKRWCVHGHLYTEATTGLDRLGKRYCKTCRYDHLKKDRAKKKARGMSRSRTGWSRG